MSEYAFIEPSSSYPLPKSFSYSEYIETEQELWALFPETDGKRVNFVQIGLTAQIFVDSDKYAGDLRQDETYILMPCPDGTMKPLRMRSCRRLTLSEYRMGHLTAIKLFGKISAANEVMRDIGCQILGPEVLDEVQSRMSGNEY